MESVWANFAPMQFLQIPARLYGPFSLGVALAVGMLLDRLAVQLVVWRRTGWVVAVASVVSVVIGRLADPPIRFLEGVSHAVDANALLRTEFNRDAWNGGAATGSGEFTPVGVDIDEAIPGRPRGNQVFDRDYPPGSWVGSTALVYAGSARITELRRDVLRNDVGVEVESSGATVAFHQLWFPGWRASIDGTEVPIRVPPRCIKGPTPWVPVGLCPLDLPHGDHGLRFNAALHDRRCHHRVDRNRPDPRSARASRAWVADHRLVVAHRMDRSVSRLAWLRQHGNRADRVRSVDVLATTSGAGRDSEPDRC